MSIRDSMMSKKDALVSQSSFSQFEIRMASLWDKSRKGTRVAMARSKGTGKPKITAKQKTCKIQASCEFDDIDPARNQIRMDEQTKRLVILIQPMYRHDDDLPDGVDVMPWLVKDILTGKIYARDENFLWGRLYNELEALGWCAEEHPDEDFLSD